MLIASVICLFVTTVAAYKTGAPNDICPYPEMKPQHGTEPQKTNPPYSVSASSLEYTPGQKITVTIRKDKGTPFLGFSLAAEENGERIGTWKEVKGKIQQLTECPVATHVNDSPKPYLELEWRAPNKKGSVAFRATVVKTGSVFWTNVFAKQAAARPFGR